MKKIATFFAFLPLIGACQSAAIWKNVDSLYGRLPASLHVYFTAQKIDTAPFKAFYVVADLRDKSLRFTTDTSSKRRLQPAEFYEKNSRPLLVMNGTFFSFETNSNLNLVIKDGKLLAHNQQPIAGRRKDTLTYSHPFSSAFGISKKRQADIAWTITDSAEKFAYASQVALPALKDSGASHPLDYFLVTLNPLSYSSANYSLKRWKMETAIGGGPVLVQNGQISR